MKVLICGHARHGKDQFCDFLGVPYQSSSMQALDACIWDKIGWRYSSKEGCFNDRMNCRAEWYNIITEYNTPDKTRLGRFIFERNDVYVGIRNRDEFYALKEAGVFDLSSWIDASARLPPEGDDSCTVMKADCDIVVTNNGTLERLREKAQRLSILFRRDSRMQKTITDWANAVYPHRTAMNAFQKMVFEEIPEFFKDQSSGSELGDIGILLFDVASLIGVDLLDEIHKKMIVNINRNWEINPGTGIMRHK